ncbi:malate DEHYDROGENASE, NAD-dependent [Dissophora globulifera]|nr:malate DEHYDROGENASE, NAD-dependent [Dissophora globulifera]
MDDWFDEGDFETARLVCLHEGLDHIEQIVETLHTLREELRAKELGFGDMAESGRRCDMLLRSGAVEQANIEIKPSMQGGSVPVFQNRKNVRLNRCVQLSLLELGMEDASVIAGDIDFLGIFIPSENIETYSYEVRYRLRLFSCRRMRPNWTIFLDGKFLSVIVNFLLSLDELATIATNHHLKRELSLARSNMMRNLGHRSQSDMIAYLDPLYIVVASGVVDDLSHIDPKCRVTSHGKDRIDEALKGVHTVVISAGVLRKPGMTRDNLLKR